MIIDLQPLGSYRLRVRTLIPARITPYLASLCVALMFVFIGASTATTLNRAQHASENAAPHEHMLLSDISYLADHDDRLHADEHHDKAAADKAENADVHALIGGEQDAKGGHTGHHHHHQGEVGGSMVVLASNTPSILLASGSGQRLVPDQIPPSAGHLLPERPPRASANHA